MKKGRINDTFDEKDIRSNRTFPKWNTVLLVIVVAAQISLVLFGILYQPKPQDVIHHYEVSVEPCSDGSLDIEYRLQWEALDASEELTWVEIGMPNPNFSVYADSVSSNVSYYNQYTDEDYVSLELHFKRAYLRGDVLEFSFKVNQKDMLCKDEDGYFYEFVPGWFNAIRVEKFTFTWQDAGKDYVKTGGLDYGEYYKMTARYDESAFTGCQTVKYRPFDASGAYNELKENKNSALALCCMGAALLIVAEVYIVDSYVSYGRGRGFLTGHGYHVHTYGRSNPHYIRARDRYNATHGGRSGGRGGGCACACACACAGGGRAGCSQKDTYHRRKKT